jgi:tetraacyldisaccharide 4'-kinase
MRPPEFWTAEGLVPRLLAPASLVWSAAAALRRAGARPFRAGVPVLCVGNLVAGGAGKTPVAIALAGLLSRAGSEPAFLTRGYGGRLAGPVLVDPARHGAAEVGDEALLLARAAPTFVARDRAAGARAATDAGAQILILDDGFQNPGIAKDWSLLVVDGGFGFGNGRVIPAGPLREPVEAGLARAQGAVLVGADETGVEARLAARLPLFHARLAAIDPARFIGRKLLAFAGIGRPAKFFATLAECGAELVDAREFPDHHRYRDSEIDALAAAARAAGASLVTTAKDHVRLPPSHRQSVEALEVELRFADEAAVAAALARLLPASPSVLSPAP